MPGIVIACAIPDSGYRQRLCDLLTHQPDIRRVDSAASGTEALELFRTTSYDVAVLDTSLRLSDGPPVLDRLFKMSARMRVILHEATLCPISPFHALHHGAWGHLTAATSGEVCLKAIRAVHAGDMWFDRAALVRVIALMRGPTVRDAVGIENKRAGLSDRECEIYSKAVQGYTNKEIGRLLRISDTTVKTHLKHIFTKLGISRRSQLHIHSFGVDTALR
jgi:DNA-binding NarL/FixJ family response regulator